MSNRLIYFVDIVEDYPSIGGVAEYSRNLRLALKRKFGARVIDVRGITEQFGCTDPSEPYLDRERRVVAAVAACHPDAVVVVPNFQNPVPRVRGQTRPAIINVVHDVQFCSLPQLFAADHLRWLHRAFAETRLNADEIVFVSRTTQDQYSACFGAPRTSTVIPPAIDLPAERPRPARQDFLLAVQHAGSHPHKNVPGLLQLFADLACRDAELTLRIAGLGGEKVEADIAKLPDTLRHRVQHVGYVPRQDLDTLYRTARAFVSLSRFEGFNMAAAEAASHGTPMLLSDLPAHRELFSGRACFLDPGGASADAATDYLSKADHQLWAAWEGRSTCSLGNVGTRWAESIGRVDVFEPQRAGARPHRRSGAIGLPTSGRAVGALFAGSLVAGLSVGASLATAATLGDCAVTSAGQGGSVSAGPGSLGGSGGTGCHGMAGSQGQPGYSRGEEGGNFYGGGGGGAAGGGTGGQGGGYYSGGAGGQGGDPGQPGQPPTTSYYGNSGGGGGGGGGGINGIVASSMVTTAIRGGAGGAGGTGSASGGAGGGGAGGFGAVFEGPVLTVASTGSLTGGNGGQGGSGDGAGSGGDGGVGIYFSGHQQTLENHGLITGGNAGAAGGAGASAGQSGIGVMGSDLHIINGGGISAGTNGTAVAFMDGDNRLTMQSGGTITGDIEVSSGARLTFDQDGPVVLKSRLTGAGDIIQDGKGTLTLADDIRTGNAEIKSGILAVSSPSAPLGLSAGKGTPGTVTFSGGTLQAAAQGIRLDNPLNLREAATIDTQSNAMWLTGQISGPGALIKQGAGQLFLYGSQANSYTGGTQINAGLLFVSARDLESGSTVDALGTGAVTLAGGTLVTVRGGTLGNAIQAKSGPGGGITSQGNTSLTLTGPIALQGESTITFGSPPVYNAPTFGGNIPLVTSPGTIVVASQTATAETSAKIIVAGGTLMAAAENPGLGNLTAKAASTTINGGTLDFNGNSATIANLLGGGGTLTNTSGTTTTLNNAAFSGAIIGGTTLAIRGGTVTLGGANSYEGGTLLQAGTLALSKAGALGTGALTMDEGTTLAFAADGLTLSNAIHLNGIYDPTIDTGAFDATISGKISGPGALTKQGTGRLTLTADSAGSIDDLGNPIVAYTGDTTVAAGALAVDGSIAKSSVFVNSGAVLGGRGTVGSVTAKAGSVVQPGTGSAFQTLNVAGDVTFAGGSTFRVKISPTGQTDSLVAGGTATLGNATLAVNEASGSYTNILSPYTILSAKSVQGRFGQVISANSPGFAFVDPTVVYGDKTVTLTFVRNDTPLPGVALTPNQVGAAGAIQNSAPPAPPTNNTTSPEPAPGPGPKRPRGNQGPDTPPPPSPAPVSIPQVLYNAVLGQTPAGAQQAYRAVAGTVYASQTASTIQASRYVSVNVLDRLFSIAGSGLDARQLLDQLSPNTLPTFINCFAPLPSAEKLVPQNVTFWGDGFGSFGKTSGNANAAGLDHALGGFILGADAPLHGFSAPYRVGLAGGYTNDSFSSRGGGASGTAESYFGSLYGSARYGSVDVRLGTSVAAIQTTADRTVAFPGFFEKEHGRYWGNVVQGFGEVGYRFATSRYVIEPVIDAAVVHIHQDGFRESGGAAALIGYAQDVDTASTTLGVRGEAALINGLPLIARTFLGWRHGYGNINPAATFAFASGSTPFSSTGAPIDRDALAAEAGLDWRASSRLTLGASYVGQIGARDMDNAVRGRVEYKF